MLPHILSNLGRANRPRSRTSLWDHSILSLGRSRKKPKMRMIRYVIFHQRVDSGLDHVVCASF